ncbi:DUF4339 domain-containing protein [Zavarzinella formosa]|uniref:DUF4339 domain-containing protein n=1 Tax=Zavarzinella formosa TaxID=360055 RepID=UPI0003036E27|nr:DUF4339 domain-containing protein [Zavarzinella formosa]
MNQEWFYSVGDTRQGPVTEEQLRQLAAEGSLKPTDLVWKDGMPDWVEARTIPGFFPERDELRKSKPQRIDDAEVVDDRPRRSRYADDDDDDRRDRRPRSRRNDDRYGDDRDDFDDNRRSGSRRKVPKPDQITSVAVMMLVGGILGILGAIAAGTTIFCCVWPGIYFEFVVGILLIVRAINMMNQDDHGPPTGLAICQICFILNGDPVNLTLGIIALVMLGSDEAKQYYRRKGF